MRRIRQLGQHQVDDVFRQVLLTTGDEDLGAADAVAAIGLRLGAGADQAQVGAGMRFGQAHRAGPAPFVHGRQVLSLELIAGVVEQRQAGACGQHRVQAKGQVGGVEHFLDLGANHFGHAHATVLHRARHTHPAILGIAAIGFGETIRSDHPARFPAAALLVAAAVKRRHHLGNELAGLFENRLGGVGIDLFGQRGYP
ncbi:hypothetical protein D3C77_476380 [compost metagenome]